jgi:hypothetical protein
VRDRLIQYLSSIQISLGLGRGKNTVVDGCAHYGLFVGALLACLVLIMSSLSKQLTNPILHLVYKY